MTTPQIISAKPKKKNCFLWGCLIISVFACLVISCLGLLVALPFFTDLDPLGFDLQHKINEFFPGEDYFNDGSNLPELPKLIESEEVPSSLSTTPDNRSSQLISYPDLDFPFTFSYPSSWAIDAEEFSDGVTFYDPSSNTTFGAGTDWLCQGCLTAVDTTTNLMETLEFQAESGNFEITEDIPFIVSTGDDARFSAYEWTDYDGNYHWAQAVLIIVDDLSAYFIMYGDAPEYLDLYREMIFEIGLSFGR